MPKFTFAVTLPLTLWVPDIEASDEAEAREKARQIAYETPNNEWGDDMSTLEIDLVEPEE